MMVQIDFLKTWLKAQAKTERGASSWSTPSWSP